MVRGEPVCRKEDCSQYDIGLVFKEISSYSDQVKLKFIIIENVWKPGELFDFPVSVECSNSNRHFVWSWLKRFPWLAYSKYLDGAFCLPCELCTYQRPSRGGGDPGEPPGICTTTFTNPPYPKERFFNKKLQTSLPWG